MRLQNIVMVFISIMIPTVHITTIILSIIIRIMEYICKIQRVVVTLPILLFLRKIVLLTTVMDFIEEILALLMVDMFNLKIIL